jgi:hypothetical protein
MTVTITGGVEASATTIAMSSPKTSCPRSMQLGAPGITGQLDPADHPPVPVFPLCRSYHIRSPSWSSTSDRSRKWEAAPREAAPCVDRNSE